MMSSSARRSRTQGFTLLELLVAITILATVSLISWRGLDSLVATRERLEPEADEIRALLTAFGQMDRDLANAVPPSLIGLSAPSVQAIAGSDGNTALQIVRFAPRGVDRASAVQTVFYTVQDGTLMRRAAPPARTLATAPVEQMHNARLLSGIRSVNFRLWRPGVGWTDPKAPAPATIPGAAATAIDGVEVTFERSDGTTYRRVLLVG
jgi:general secretion pathway protein J